MASFRKLKIFKISAKPIGAQLFINSEKGAFSSGDFLYFHLSELLQNKQKIARLFRTVE
jgi:hypothetical protein